jgi:hypothetical protein
MMWIALLFMSNSSSNRTLWFRATKMICFYTFVSSLFEPSSNMQQFECISCLTSYVFSVNTLRILSQVCRSQWPRGRRRRSAAARLLRLWVRIPTGAWILSVVSVVCLSGRRLCDGLIIRPEESYRLWSVVVCELDTSWIRRPWPTGVGGGAEWGCCVKKNFVERYL